MKKLLLPLAIGSALSLVGCGSGDEAPITESEVNVAASRVVFDPSNGALSAPTNILLSGSVDGTLNLPVADATDTANPQVAINALDGWGTHSTLTFDFSLPVDENGEQVIIESASLEAQGSIRVFETIQGGSDVSAGCAAANPAAVCAVTGELQHGTDFIVKATGEGSVAVVPLRPFKPATGYLVVLTNNIQDSLGRDVKPSQTYTLMKRDAEENPVSGDASALALQGLVNSYEGALAQYGVDPEGVIYSSNFTTQSVGEVLGVTKSLLGQQVAASNPPVMQAAPQGYTLDVVLSGAGIEDPNALAAASAAKVYGGQVDLPYYSPLPSAENPTAPLTGRWTAMCDSPAAILNGLQAGEIDPAAEGISAEMIDDPSLMLPPNACFDIEGVDEERHLTKYNPVPEKQGDQTVEAFVTIPDLATANGVRTQMGLEPLTAPENGWPVVIFQHGITGEKENAAAIAGTFAVAGFATVAIDHPLHGGRAFDVDGDGTDDIDASSESGVTAYMNLSSLLTTRDNLRQSITDLIGLRLSLNYFQSLDGEELNGQDVHFVGHSLGAIAGTGFTALANTSFGENNPLGALDGQFAVQASSLGMPGGSLANFLLASDSFGPTIKATLLYSSNAEFKAAADQAIAGGATLEQFYAGFMEQASAEQVAQINATFEQFAFAAQTVVDSGDPVNYASDVVASETPVFMIEAIGDSVIPNAVENKPLAGTEPLAALLGLEGISTTTTSEDGTPVSGIVRFGGDAEHGSLVDSSASGAVTAEMQQQIAFWFAADMMQLPVTNEEVVE
ncbi:MULTISPECIES: VolA/Pla-1 family phospholipase [Idiomarina]|uniref:Alpha/beta hydrolase n=2 Tax=Idiomarina abyssalis TaxID=86102 RepID=A0A8I1GCH6_9GAMM|nr:MULTISPECIES: VolA/Pla-1 family phospholipase [Idiomarina]KPD22223.1 alpha/beta hydrolase [Idiomarina abyssalis]MBJ7267143.1 alpha/beta hydrolase [Idiomarina abyssalis]MBJ7274171.1 alpha/beta hydrolase [Idiomarina abyssalis]MBJ7315881.1 alpha/beta hydrolase [Idiomarina abyssalis]SFT36709.1 extracellular lipase, Pla-1/cef family [Idiomarina abyssalis]|tara:strand:+ start:169628 stop:171997 length:2370 start_codon:yes stop_codon:yes gene_type:complete